MKRPVLLLTAGLAVLLSSCKALKEATGDPQPDNKAYDVGAVTPPDFLFTRSDALNKWLDTPVRVQIHDVHLRDVFRHDSLRGLQYSMVKPPQQNPLVNIDKIAMTRRQLLWAISHDHQLQMTPAYNSKGNVSHIEIRSRSVDLPKVEALN